MAKRLTGVQQVESEKQVFLSEVLPLAQSMTDKEFFKWLYTQRSFYYNFWKTAMLIGGTDKVVPLQKYRVSLRGSRNVVELELLFTKMDGMFYGYHFRVEG